MNQRGVIALVAIFLIAAVVVWITGIASGGGDAAPPPFSVAESEVPAECMSGTFVPEGAGAEIAGRPPPHDWRRIEEAPKAMPAERGAVLVTLRPDEHRVEGITITGISFHVFNLGLRPIGIVFYRPCGRRPTGAAVETDLDGYTHKVISSEQDGALRVGFHLSSHFPPIRFPWTVSLTKPLKLYLAVQARDIYCDWTARIAWTSASSHGVIRVDNGGRKYRIVDGQGTGWYRPSPGGQWDDSGSSRWIGVR